MQKKSALKKHINRKHSEQKCNICEKVFPSIIDALKHTASHHNKEIKDDNKEKEPAMRTKSLPEEKDSFDLSTKFKCFKCKEVVLIDDKFNEVLEEDQLCKLCTMIKAYG